MSSDYKELPLIKMLIGEYILARTFSAGIFVGIVEDIDLEKGRIVRLKNARRLWKWEGASSLSELSQTGTILPDKCLFPCEVPFVVLTEVIEYLPVSDKAKESIASVPVWSAINDKI